MFIIRDRDRDRQQSQQALEFRHSTTSHVTRIHDQRRWGGEPGTLQVTNYPPVISFTINHDATGSLKDTSANLKNSQGFPVNIISEAFVENANATVVDAPSDFDE
ncbi:hypothetical protein BDR06DRAFT_1006849 [Suillus hirtellus]|nr:hypothetical protein BDR06DRAFT_1006849 [Suillus hirtellus]